MATHFQRKINGSAFIEIAISVGLVVILSALGADVSLVTYGMFLNDKACRDACRAAAQQTNSASALSAAQVQLKVHSTDGNFVSQPTLVSTSSPNFVYNDYGGSPPTNTSPYVTVTTSVTITLPAPIFFWQTFVMSDQFQFTRRYTYPIVKEKFYG